MTGRIFEIRELTLHDGPGVRTTVFFKGCPLRCAWCHNPEGQSFDVETMTRRDGTKVSCGQDWTAEALAKELLKNADIMKQSGGGVTFSGGEPLAQAEFLLELIPLLKRGGVNLTLETSGAADTRTYQTRQLQNPVLSRPPRQALARGLAVTAPVAEAATVRLRVLQLPRKNVERKSPWQIAQGVICPIVSKKGKCYTLCVGCLERF